MQQHLTQEQFVLQVQVVCPQPQEQLCPGVQFAQQPFFAQEQQPTMANARPTATTSFTILPSPSKE